MGQLQDICSDLKLFLFSKDSCGFHFVPLVLITTSEVARQSSRILDEIIELQLERTTCLNMTL